MMKKKNKTSIGCLFWIALILLALVLFLFNRKTIENVLTSTGFLEVLQKEKDQEDETPPAVTMERPEKPNAEKPREETPIQIVVPDETPEEKQPVEDEKPEIPPQMRRSTLYFVKVEDSGEISLKNVVRPVYYNDSPLTETVRALITGLTPSELNSGLLTLIPEGTILKSVSVSNGIAYMDFSEEFRFNLFGVEGYQAQLKQVVFTATEFPTVTAVQILIEGTKRDFLGPEGISIASPLTRDSF